ncbi:MAG: FKBP-type peptidyl-prolyl cis-trans isomerase [Planctomycetota bacterium]
MTKTIEDGRDVELELIIHDANGELVERTDDGEPFRCRIGEAELPPGLERELAGKSTGHRFDLELPPEDAFGPHDPSQVISIPHSDLPPDVDVSVGDLLPVLLEPEEGEEGEPEEIELQVVAVDQDAVTVDLNHPYAGLTLRFQGTVVAVS